MCQCWANKSLRQPKYWPSIPVFMVQKGSSAPRHGARMEMEQNSASCQEGFCPVRGRGPQGPPSSQMTALGMGHARPQALIPSSAVSQEATVTTLFLDSLTSDSACVCSVIYKV